MATWTNVDNADLGVGDPIRSIDIVAMNDNVTAVMEGATGAPKLTGEAVKRLSDYSALTVAAASTYLLGYGITQVNGTTSVSTTTWTTCSTTTVDNYTGSIRFTANAYYVDSFSGSGQLRVLLNGSVQQTWSINSPTVTTYSRDISITPTDVVTWQIFVNTPGGGTAYGYYSGDYADDAYILSPPIIQATTY